jgi:UDP-N-acetylmuramoyl-L-alanyl-D-glutamate--2,6-diaminopimelate ligase
MVSLQAVLKTLDLPFQESSAQHAFQDLVSDPRTGTPQDLFILLPSAKRSSAMLFQTAFSRGATAFITEDAALCAQKEAFFIHVASVQKALMYLCPLFYAPFPDHLVAVTGTNGKTSVTHLLHQLWKLAHIPSAALGTLGLISSCPLPFAYPKIGPGTTPSAPALHKILGACVQHGIQHVAFEVSSHALTQNRLTSLCPSLRIFTSFSQDHLDYHGSMSAYWDAKCRLFRQEDGHSSWQAILFQGLPHFEALLSLCKAQGVSPIVYGPKEASLPKGMTLSATYQRMDAQRVSFTCMGYAWESHLSFIADFQLENLLAALCAFSLSGGQLERIIPSLSLVVSPPGRMEHVGSFRDAPIFVDYAHTPEALAFVLAALRPKTVGKIGVIFGCGGEREHEKRKAMGAIAEQLADWIIVTDDNPRHEDPHLIRQEILSGMTHHHHVQEIFPRQEAIHQGIQTLHPGDCLIIAGKGHELTQEIKGETFSFSDVECVQMVCHPKGTSEVCS